MLVLTRKADESIQIGEGGEVKVLSIGEGQVRLGIIAPRRVAVLKKELYDEVRLENRRAAVAPGKEGAEKILRSLDKTQC